MGYQTPPSVATILPATVAVATDTTVIAAPGAGTALRLVGGMLYVNRAVTGIVDAALTNGAAGAVIAALAGLSVAGKPGDQIVLPEPGYQLSLNTALVLNHIASAAVGSIRLVVYYYIDTVT
jgi:hypothetical protein